MDLFGSGLWIPLIIFLVAVIYAIYLFFVGLEKYRKDLSDGSSKIGESFSGDMVAVELIRSGYESIEKGEYRRALDFLEKSMKLNPQLPLTHYLLGKAYYCIGEKQKAMDHFGKYLSVATGYDEKQRERILDARRYLYRIKKGEP